MDFDGKKTVGGCNEGAFSYALNFLQKQALRTGITNVLDHRIGPTDIKAVVFKGESFAVVLHRLDTGIGFKKLRWGGDAQRGQVLGVWIMFFEVVVGRTVFDIGVTYVQDLGIVRRCEELKKERIFSFAVPRRYLMG